MKMLRQLFSRIREDARGASLYARSHFEAFALSRKKKRDGRALLVAYREIGDRASESEEAMSRRSFGSVRENEARLAECDAVLTAARETEDRARRGLEERTRAREDELEALAGEESRLSRLQADANRDLRELQREIDRIETRLEKPGEGDSSEELHSQLAEIQSGRPEREDAGHRARIAAEQKTAELRREKQAWAEEEERLENGLREASRAAREAEVRREQARAAVKGSREALGKSVVLAGLDEPAIKEPMDRAKALLAGIKESDDGIRNRRVAAATARGEATRFVAVWGGVLLVFVLVLGVAFSGHQRGVARILPDEPARTPSEDGTASTRPVVPTPSGGEEETADVPVEKFRAALLAHQVLQSVKPAGKLEILSRAPASGGAERIDLKVPAERDGEEVRVVLRITVDPEGRLLGVDHRGEETKEDDELMKLLEELE